jgi:16S rRNA (adenine1518-N6/adenine1519-N6)-dimethyltransferase
MMMIGIRNFTKAIVAHLRHTVHMLRDEIISFLRSHNVRLNTDAGQHFLVDQDTLDDIVRVAAVEKNDRIWEIGPGIGILTRELLRCGANITAVEIDQRLIPLLQEFIRKDERATILCGNALHTPTPTDGPFKVVANIPYHITSPLLHHLLLESPVLPTSMTLLIQREVAENISAVGSPSILTVLTQLFGTASLVRLVPPEAFLPPPAVDSAVLHISCFTKPLAEMETVKRILSLVKHAMSKRRKMLTNTVGTLPGGTQAMSDTGIDATRRPQTLNIHEWIALEQALHAHRS